ncbi:dTDP-4-dehydrorhamnose 3,5-epimerase [Maritalea porphyrae]|uniref:dTDP-4-dehydrorhamnose 3,5-epimerase n=1 Tax=Maritalea porphyrae TaxID=880732 RepID=A0ABQ5UVD9_9HYPH|nr:dTDP-4-dehydrorhamnose 3,5-epimerase [Maritalea porphyrae]GLQ18647.1 dTDP-4-dehydrorhamnose 3,5-epimerase [Maritalea porphyrae]
MQVSSLGLDGVYEIFPNRFEDERGFFSETYNRNGLLDAGIETEFVQDNQSFSTAVGTMRGLHFQKSPKAQYKLVRVIKGRIFDVAVDIRRGSKTFGEWVGLEISEKKWNQILVPEGYAHGFVTLEANTIVAYKVSDFYSREHERSIRFDDPQIGVNWPIGARRMIVSAKDASAPSLEDSDLE